MVRLLLQFGVDIDSELNLQRIRKQILLEFAVAENGIIHIDDHSYNKNDLLEEIDRENFVERWHYHKLIWERKQILEVLEDDIINLDTINDELNHYRNDYIFKEFISPYFSYSFNSMAKTLLSPPKLGTLSLLMNYQVFILDEDIEYAFSSIIKYLSEQEKLFKNISKETFHLHSKSIAQWTSGNWGEFLDKLPDIYYSYKEEIVVALINLTVELQHDNTKVSKAISSQLALMKNIDEQHFTLIQDNEKIFQGEKSYWWVFWVVFVLAKIFTGC
jgi:hypothetical protein